MTEEKAAGLVPDEKSELLDRIKALEAETKAACEREEDLLAYKKWFEAEIVRLAGATDQTPFVMPAMKYAERMSFEEVRDIYDGLWKKFEEQNPPTGVGRKADPPTPQPAAPRPAGIRVGNPFTARRA